MSRKKWWADSRKMRSVRRRLRAGYRGALKAALHRKRVALEREYATKLAELRELEAEMHKGHSDLLKSLWSLGPARLSEYQLSKTLTVQCSLRLEQIWRAKDVNVLVMYLAESMGRTVHGKVIELFAQEATSRNGRGESCVSNVVEGK